MHAGIEPAAPSVVSSASQFPLTTVADETEWRKLSI